MNRRWLYGAAGTLGTALLTAVSYLAADAWEQVSHVPVLEERLTGLDGRLGRIEGSLDLLLRLQLRRLRTDGTMVLCKDDRGLVQACEEN